MAKNCLKIAKIHKFFWKADFLPCFLASLISPPSHTHPAIWQNIYPWDSSFLINNRGVLEFSFLEICTSYFLWAFWILIPWISVSYIHTFFDKIPFYMNHRGSDLVKSFTKSGENLIYWNEDYLQMKVYLKRSILSIYRIRCVLYKCDKCVL